MNSEHATTHKGTAAKGVKKCPRCELGVLVIRTNGDTEEKFLGCTEFPRCRHSEELPEDMQLRASGAPTLPGMD